LEDVNVFPTEIVTFLRDMLVPPEGTPYEKTKLAGWSRSQTAARTQSPVVLPWLLQAIGVTVVFFLIFFENKGKDEKGC